MRVKTCLKLLFSGLVTFANFPPHSATLHHQLTETGDQMTNGLWPPEKYQDILGLNIVGNIRDYVRTKLNQIYIFEQKGPVFCCCTF